MSRTTLRTLVEGAVLVAAAVGIGAVVYAQQAPTHAPSAPAPDQVAQTPPAAKPPATKPAAPAPQPPAAQQSQQPPAAAPTPQTQQQPPQGQPAPQPTVFDEHAKQGKIAKCANVFGGLGRLVAAGSAYSAKSTWNAEAGDAHSVQSVVALSNVNPANPAQRAAGIVFAAPVGNACEGSLVRVTPTTDNCQVVAAELAKQNGQTGVLGDMTLMTMPNGAQVMLVPLANACVAVSVLQGAG
ncbi:hypothetical protein [Reyranella sp. CPCC 100927]|uniref:hypothetical protein n=1 Tax=Reyranella sp. CPCC 100927 TaxID=2599616 RepID=UPI0011B75E8E|nr:hypothetical protein [Reyranella sp. CPCC 100927]TWS94451.1 hypothetical protein FQU96_41115 [Reyranella sp. CPCC 100927]